MSTKPGQSVEVAVDTEPYGRGPGVNNDLPSVWRDTQSDAFKGFEYAGIGHEYSVLNVNEYDFEFEGTEDILRRYFFLWSNPEPAETRFSALNTQIDVQQGARDTFRVTNQAVEIGFNEEERDFFVDYIGYPIQLTIYPDLPAVQGGGYTSGPTVGGATINCWLGGFSGPDQLGMRLLDYNGDPLPLYNPMTDTAGQAPHAWLSSVNTGFDPTNFSQTWRIDPKTSAIINSPGRLDSDGFRQPAMLLGPDGTLQAGITQGVQEINTLALPGVFTRNTIANIIIQSSVVYQQVVNPQDLSVISPDKHVITALLTDRTAVGLDETPIFLSDYPRGLWEIPRFSGRYYNIVQLRETEDDTLFLTFERAQDVSIPVDDYPDYDDGSDYDYDDYYDY